MCKDSNLTNIFKIESASYKDLTVLQKIVSEEIRESK
jgi:ribosomal protein S18